MFRQALQWISVVMLSMSAIADIWPSGVVAPLAAGALLIAGIATVGFVWRGTRSPAYGHYTGAGTIGIVLMWLALGFAIGGVIDLLQTQWGNGVAMLLLGLGASQIATMLTRLGMRRGDPAPMLQR